VAPVPVSVADFSWVFLLVSCRVARARNAARVLSIQH
jgi:hypothetical protein